MANGLETSWRAAMPASQKTEGSSTRTFKSLLIWRLLAAIFGIVLPALGVIVVTLIWLPETMAVAAMTFGAILMIAGIVALRLYIMPHWCLQDETITFLEDGFESKLHGRVCCKDVVSYGLSTLFGSDKSIRIVTRDKTIQYNIGRGDDVTYPWLAAQVQDMVAGFNDEAAKTARAASPVDGTHGDTTPASSASGQHDGRVIKEDSFLKSAGASVLVGVGFVMSVSLFFVPGSGGSGSAMAIMLFGFSMSMLGMIIKARKQP